MEPLAEDNEKLKAAIILMEKTCRRPSVSETLLSPTLGTWSTKKGSYPSR